MAEDAVKFNQKVINLIGRVAGFKRPLSAKEFSELDKGDYVKVDDYLKYPRKKAGK